MKGEHIHNCENCSHFVPVGECWHWKQVEARYGEDVLMNWVEHPEQKNHCVFFKRQKSYLTTDENLS